MKNQIYKPKNQIRIVTATSLFDGHDVSINIMRRILQSAGAEVIHLGHNRSSLEIARCAIQEDVQAIAVTSYQGGHLEFFRYLHDLLKEQDCSYIKIFGGGGGTILPDEVKALHQYGICRIYSPDDGRAMGLQGMINDLLSKCDFSITKHLDDINNIIDKIGQKDFKSIARAISIVENFQAKKKKNFLTSLNELLAAKKKKAAKILGVTGPGGAGKSSLIDELIRRYKKDFPKKSIAVLSVDPSKRKTGGALLGDRIRMNSIQNGNVYFRSLATRGANLSLSRYIKDALTILKAAGFDLIMIETSGIGQADTGIVDYSDHTLYVMTGEFGAPLQLEKIDMLDYASFVAINKSDKQGSLDALRDVKKQYKQSHRIFDSGDINLPVFATCASQFNDTGMNHLYQYIINRIDEKNQRGETALLKVSPKTTKKDSNKIDQDLKVLEKSFERGRIIPPERTGYLKEIIDTIRQYNKWADQQSEVAQSVFAIKKSIQAIQNLHQESEEQFRNSKGKIKNKLKNKKDTIHALEQTYQSLISKLDDSCKKILDSLPEKFSAYKNDIYTFQVRNKRIEIKTYELSLAGLRYPKISLPNYQAWGDLLRWILKENVPGEFPFTAGVFPFKREEEQSTRMFAGEGSPEKTNKRFHYLSSGQGFNRLSTAFDSVTLYGQDPNRRLDIYGKIGNSGVSVCCLDDVKKLYSGYNLLDPKTSVSMTINGPAPIMVGFFLNAAIDQQCEIYIKKSGQEKEITEKINKMFKTTGIPRPQYNGARPKGNDGLGLFLLGVTGDQALPKDMYQKIKAETLKKIRGTVQADILKEDQAQNSCIFSTDFSLRLMGDMQEYFIKSGIKNFYSVSISGYHIAEAGANPITQLAFTLANGFTYVEYYLSRGMDIDEFAPNLSFFFSNGIDPEYAVIGRVARRIWAKAMKYKYHANERSQKLKYHIQTSGRSLHAQEIDFNDVRTTLQALYAIYDNCNSLHTNAYDEAITTPTEESVRRALAIQLIISKELGLAKNQNPLQGAFIIEELTDLVEEAVLFEFDSISKRGGVLGAMEHMYQRGKIQEESLHYENLKQTGEYVIVGVNTFLSKKGSLTLVPNKVIRAVKKEKEDQIKNLKNLLLQNKDTKDKIIKTLQQKTLQGRNIFPYLMEAVKYCSLGQLTQTLYEVGGQYRRSM